MSQWPALEQFLGAWFHQDWSLDDPTASAVISRFLGEVPLTTVAACLDEISRVSALGLDDGALRKLLQGLGCAYWPPGDGLSYAEWLRQVQARLQAALGGAPAAR